jgi:hypothetical protein
MDEKGQSASGDDDMDVQAGLILGADIRDATPDLAKAPNTPDTRETLVDL